MEKVIIPGSEQDTYCRVTVENPRRKRRRKIPRKKRNAAVSLEVLAQRNIAEDLDGLRDELLSSGHIHLPDLRLTLLEQFIKEDGSARTCINHFENQAEAFEPPVFNILVQHHDQDMYLHCLGPDQSLLVSSEPILETPVIRSNKRKKKKILTKKQVQEAYVLRFVERVKMKDLGPMFGVHPTTLHYCLRAYLRTGKNSFVQQHLDEIREENQLDEPTDLLTPREVGARLTVSNPTIERYVDTGFFVGYTKKVGSKTIRAVSSSFLIEFLGKHRGQRLINGAEFFRITGWMYRSILNKVAWGLLEHLGIEYLPITPYSKEEIGPSQYYRLCRIPESQIKIGIARLKEARDKL